MLSVTLNNGVTIPQLGFGTWQVPPESARDRVLEALEVGYRHIDTAQMYGNEAGVGQAVADSGIARDEVFLTTKLNNTNHTPEKVASSIDESLEKLQVDAVDLFLIHWPLPTTEFDYVETWKAMEQVLADGKARAVGLSNFQPAHVERVLAQGSVVPAANQIEIHPYFVQDELRRVNADAGIATEAWSPLAQGEVLTDEMLTSLAEKTGRTVAQIVIRWHLQRGDIVFPKASNRDRIAQNFDVFDFELSEDDMVSITELDQGRRIGPDPDTFAHLG